MVSNYLLRKGLRRYSPSALRMLRGRPKLTKPKAVAAPAAVKPAQPKDQKKRAKIPSMRNVLPLNDRRRRMHRAWVRNPPKLRRSLVPGTVLIMLAGRFRGKRVVFLQQLPSGLLLITGPFKINGVPLRRVSQNYVIATSTKVPLKDLKIDPKEVNDAIFSKRAPLLKKRKSQAAFFGKASAAASSAKKAPKAKKQKKVEKAKIEEYKKKKAERKAAKAKAKAEAKEEPKDKKKKKEQRKKPLKVSHERSRLQKKIDAQVLPGVKQVPLLRNYLTARFSLQNHEHPHLIKF